MNELNKLQISLTQNPGERTEESQLLQNLLANVLGDQSRLADIIGNQADHLSRELEGKIRSLKHVLRFMENDLVQEQYEKLLKEKEALDALYVKLRK
ncbi:hypothetical protein NS29R_09695 [Enterobacter hormaechei subsp. xiangfangensis]|uniref:hypothetical protein n=1 Tax=Enterobacter hormaechei TaxID=158836 RepID=UPI0007376C1C|nr:hypothetical protein [Enterobacter hormaechei]KTQ60481.1 hypothetical protein NS28R_11255 [Enterobacter hormaechei subsp. xiangfangensis]KTQ62061.1 hypothetical protein NS23R_01625 [Enterobacter hormaechei]KTQ66680.1 hypothetical protein NS34R_02080 [Enterobacter hormaechei]KTQ67692.1 hypothetical protein NS19R_17880 [Enterobacter hormaechei subsp. xiangfangensis]KTQ81755.1 hypothetical protein NS7_06155 [Enterobacter hormaechei]